MTTLPQIRLRHPGLVQHRRSLLPLADLARCRGIPITSPARTLLDAAPMVHPSRLGPVVDDALRRKLCVKRVLVAGGCRAGTVTRR